MEPTQQIEAIYYNPKSPGSFGGIKKLYDTVKEKGVKLKDVEKWIKGQETYSLFRDTNKRFPRLPILVDKVDEQWQADLMDMSWILKSNDNYKYLLAIIDCLSRYAWVIPLKDKTSSTIINAFKTILTKRKPDKLQTDKGKEFVNSQFKSYMKSLNINFFTSTDDVIKCAIVERFNRTLRTKIYRYLHYSNTHRYIDVLNELVDSYNNSFHRTIKMTPIEAQTNQSLAINNVFKAQKKSTKKQVPLKVGDAVRITRAKTLFEKGATSKWTTEIFYITKVKHTPQGYVYRLKDWDGEPLTSIFYHDELQLAKEPDSYKIQVLKTRTNPKTKKKEYYIKYIGYPDKFNTWTDTIENGE